LIWDDRSARREEHPNCLNHLTDATLYAWRYCYAYLSEIQPPKPKPKHPRRNFRGRVPLRVEFEMGAASG
jgi:hypothetical protein